MADKKSCCQCGCIAQKPKQQIISSTGHHFEIAGQREGVEDIIMHSTPSNFFSSRFYEA